MLRPPIFATLHSLVLVANELKLKVFKSYFIGMPLLEKDIYLLSLTKYPPSNIFPLDWTINLFLKPKKISAIATPLLFLTCISI